MIERTFAIAVAEEEVGSYSTGESGCSQTLEVRPSVVVELAAEFIEEPLPYCSEARIGRSLTRLLMWSCWTASSGSLLPPFDSYRLAEAAARRTSTHFGLDEVAQLASEFRCNMLASGLSR